MANKNFVSVYLIHNQIIIKFVKININFFINFLLNSLVVNTKVFIFANEISNETITFVANIAKNK